MNIDGLVTVQPEQTEVIDNLVAMMGEAYLEEPYTKVFLEGIRAKGDQGPQISEAIMRALIANGAGAERVYCTEDGNACAIAYRNSEQAKPNMYYEDLALEAAKTAPCLGDKQAGLVFLQKTIMWPVSDFEWYPDVVGEGADYIHLTNLGVKVSEQHKGKLDELLKPILAYADSLSLPVFLECYSDELEKMYEHYGFKTLEVLDSPTTVLKERCMMYQKVA